MARKGMGRGTGKGYKNLISRDKRIHSMSAKGIKQPQCIRVDVFTKFKKPIIDLNKYGQKEHVSSFGFNLEKTVVHGTSLSNAIKIIKDKKFTEGTFVYPSRGGFEDATNWSQNVFEDKGVVIVAESIEELPRKSYEWISVGKRREERKGLDKLLLEIKFKKIKVFKPSKDDKSKLEEIKI